MSAVRRLRDDVHVGRGIRRGDRQAAEGVLVGQSMVTGGRRWAEGRQVRRRQHRVTAVNRTAGIVLHEILELRHAQARRIFRHRQIRHLRQKKHSDIR